MWLLALLGVLFKQASVMHPLLKTSILLFLLFPQMVNAGGGWTQGKGNGFFMLSQRVISANFYATNQAQIIQTPLAGMLTTNIYAEYGFTNRLDVYAFSPVLSGHFVQGGTTENGQVITEDQAWGLGDIDAGFKYALLKSDKWNVALSGMLGIPSGNDQAGETGQLMLGDGEFNQLVQLWASRGFTANWFGTLMFGANNRTQQFSDELHACVEVGYTKSRYTFMVKSYMLKSLNNGSAQEATVPGIYSHNLEYVSVSLTGMYRIKNGGIIIDLGFAPYLRNIIAAPSVSVGYFFNLRR